MVQTNSATAEQSAAASQELSGQARLLNNLLSQFTFRSDLGHGTGKTEPAVHTPAPAPAPHRTPAAPKPKAMPKPAPAPSKEPAPAESFTDSGDAFDISDQVGEIHFQDDFSKY